MNDAERLASFVSQVVSVIERIAQLPHDLEHE
jgi:hypothetical protein